MNTNFSTINNNLINLSLVNSFNYKNSFSFSIYNKIILGFNIRDSYIETTSVYFPKTLWLLEHIGLQKGHVITLKTKRVGRNQRRVIFSSQVILRKSQFFNFIYFFLYFAIYGFFRKFISFNLNIDKLTGDYSFLIKDINIYGGYLEDFFKWFYPILVNLVMSHFDVVLNQHVLQELGFNVV